MMLYQKFLFFFSILYLTSLHTGKAAPAAEHLPALAPVRWAVQKSSSIRVGAKSNVTDFSCDIEGYYRPDTIVCYNNKRSDPVMLTGSLTIDLLAFDCHSRFVTRDMRKMLKAEVYPHLIIEFISLDRMPVFTGNTDPVTGYVIIELAGVRKKFDILYSFIKPGTSSIVLNGGRTFNFSDFNVKPPRKLGGVIKIKNEFSVVFRLSLIPS